MAEKMEIEPDLQSEEILEIKKRYPNRCRVISDSGKYKNVVKVQPENLDVTINFQLTDSYPSTVPDVAIRSESLTPENVESLKESMKSKSLSLIGRPMITELLTLAEEQLLKMGLRKGKTRNVNPDKIISQENKKKKKPKQKKKILEDDDDDKKFPPMKTSEDVVKRIIWDENLDKDDFLVGYIDRFKGLQEKYFSAFSWEDLAVVDYDVLAIPKHRIQYFKYKTVKVWDKLKRIDNVFGSAKGTKTIDIVMKEYEENELRDREIESRETESERVENNSTDDEISSDEESDDDGVCVNIGPSAGIGLTSKAEAGNKDKAEVDEDDSIDPFWRNKLRPNYFVAIRITNKSIMNEIGNVQDRLMETEPLFAECCIPGRALHLTICTLGLDTPEQLTNGIETLKKIATELQAALPKSPLKLKGVSNFYNRVVYAKVEQDPEFVEFCDTMKMLLKEAGLSIRDGYEFVPHVTIMKTTRPVSRLRGTKNIDKSLYQPFVETAFGEQTIDGVYLCSMGESRRDDGFYLTPAEIQF